MVDNLFHLSRFDQDLKTNMKVSAYWTANGYSYSGKGIIISLKRYTVTVRLEQSIKLNGAYQTGRTIELPRFSDQTRWSARNCVQPI